MSARVERQRHLKLRCVPGVEARERKILFHEKCWQNDPFFLFDSTFRVCKQFFFAELIKAKHKIQFRDVAGQGGCSQNFLRNSYELLTIFLWTSYKILANFLPTSYELLMKLCMNFLWPSYKLLMNFLWTSHELLMNFLWTSYELLMNFLQTSYELLRNFLGTS
jgi:hypothetical protein